MKSLILTTCILVCAFAAFCQNSYLNLEGKTVEGKIENYKEWVKNPSSVLFRDVNGAEITLTPGNSAGFSVGDDHYISFHGTRIINSENAMKNTGLLSPVATTDSVNVFLLEIYQFDNYKLYKLSDSKRTNFYYSKNDNIRELQFYESLDGSQVILFNGYKNLLNEEFADRNVPHFNHKIELLAYKENDLVNFLASMLNDGTHGSPKLRNKYPGETFMGAGLNANMGTINNSIAQQTSFAPSIEFGFRMFSQRNFGKFFFQPYVTAFSLENSFSKIQAKIKAMVVTVNLGAGYLFVKKPNFSFYGEAAGSLPILFNLQAKSGANGKYVGGGAEDRITVHPELGVIVNQHWNIAVNDMLAISLPFYGNMEYAYKLSQASVVIRYCFTSGHK